MIDHLLPNYRPYLNLHLLASHPICRVNRGLFYCDSRHKTLHSRSIRVMELV